MDDKKIADLQTVWAYVLKSGVITSGEYSYYGGEWERVDETRTTDRKKETETLIKHVQTFDVDWDKTTIPEYRLYSDFVDSESPSLEVETLKGVITLKNGQSFTLGVRNPVSEYIDLIEKLNKPVVPDLKTQVFGSRAIR